MIKNRLLRIVLMMTIICGMVSNMCAGVYAEDAASQSESIESDIVYEEEDVFPNEEMTVPAEEETDDVEEDVFIEDEMEEEDAVVVEEGGETDGAAAVTFSVWTEEQEYTEFCNAGVHYLFLPAQVSLSDVHIRCQNKSISEAAIGEINEEGSELIGDIVENQEYTVTFTDETTAVFCVMRSNISSLCLNLNGVTLSQVDAGSKAVKYPGNSVTLTNPDNAGYNFTDNDVEFKGRGNFTWTLDKKSYQIKLSSKTNVLGMGKAKKWVLLANHDDDSLIKNKLVFDIARECGLQNTSEAAWVDLFVDGAYRGNYLLTEKVEIGSSRVNLTAQDGVLVELDNLYYQDETTIYTTTAGNHYVLKESVADDEGKAGSVAAAAMKAFGADMEILEKELARSNPDWEKVSSLVDVESFARVMLLQELSKNRDAMRTSLYFYRDGAEDKIHMGPVWDFGIGFGAYPRTHYFGQTTGDCIYQINVKIDRCASWMDGMMNIAEFREMVHTLYKEEFKGVFETAIDKAEAYKSEITHSADMNFIRWNKLGMPSAGSNGRLVKTTYAEEVLYMEDRMRERLEYLENRYGNSGDMLYYTTHVQGHGWMKEVTNDMISGTMGESKRVEAFKIWLNTDDEENCITYRALIQGDVWQKWVRDGALAGTTGQRKYVEGVQIKLEGPIAEEYDVWYQAYSQTYGWLGWAKNGESAGSINCGKRIEAIHIKLLPKGNEIVDDKVAFVCAESNFEYQAYVQGVGWQTIRTAGSTAGDTTNKKRVEAIRIRQRSSAYPGSIIYGTYVQDEGWQEDVQDYAASGTTGQSKHIEAIHIRLTDELEKNCDVYYRTYVDGFGWLGWAKNGENSGTSGYDKKICGVQVRFVPKGTVAPGATANAYRVNNSGSDDPIQSFEASVTYRTHVQTYGWQDWVQDGMMSGTSGKAKRLEGIEIELSNQELSGSIRYCTHVQTYGWQEWVKDGAMSGTSGEAKRLEAIRIQLTGDIAQVYDVYYRVHVQTYGWQDWVKNGMMAGTMGEAKRLEAIEIKLVKK